MRSEGMILNLGCVTWGLQACTWQRPANGGEEARSTADGLQQGTLSQPTCWLAGPTGQGQPLAVSSASHLRRSYEHHPLEELQAGLEGQLVEAALLQQGAVSVGELMESLACNTAMDTSGQHKTTVAQSHAQHPEKVQAGLAEAIASSRRQSPGTHLPRGGFSLHLAGCRSSKATGRC